MTTQIQPNQHRALNYGQGEQAAKKADATQYSGKN